MTRFAAVKYERAVPIRRPARPMHILGLEIGKHPNGGRLKEDQASGRETAEAGRDRRRRTTVASNR
jgi:hypothetical protein